MANTPEGKVKKRCKAVFEKLKMYWVMLVTGGLGASGHPDFLLCIRGTLIGLETKSTALDIPTQLQIQQLQTIEEAGGVAMVVHESNLEESLRIIKEFAEGDINLEYFKKLVKQHAPCPTGNKLYCLKATRSTAD